MPEKPIETLETEGSSVSRWILFGGVIILVVSVCLLFAGVFVAQKDRRYQSANEKTSDDQISETTFAQGAQENTTNSSSATSTDAQNSSVFSTSTNEQAKGVAETEKSPLSDPSIMWQHIDEEEVEESKLPNFPRVVSNRALVRMNSSVWTTTEGHRVQFPIPQRDIVLVGEVTSVGGTPLAPTLKGEVTDLGENYPFTLTLSKAQAFATVTSSTGNYELFANRDYGWVMAAADMDDHVDYSVPHTFFENPDPHSGHEHLPH
ncbi:MAG: hypothetical protein OXG24_12425 [Gammaproteobacteria bacterium]|nr:hypothetical protein [Gammaproteobacteria bacterium]